MHISELIRQLGSFNPTTQVELKTKQEQISSCLSRAFDDLERTLTESQLDSAHRILNRLELTLTYERDPLDAVEPIQAMKAFIEHAFSDAPFLTPPEMTRTPDAEMSRSLFFGLNTESIDTWKEFADKPELHPEYIYFTAEMHKTFPEANEGEIRDLFISLMKATVFELENIELLEGQRKQIPAFETAPKDNMARELYATTRQIIGHRTLNPYFQRAMTTMKTLDRNGTMFHGCGINSDPTKRQASLWTGGKAVMLYARRDFRVLETTLVGSVFDQFKLHPDWRIQYPLWNLLSEAFVESDILRQVQSGTDPIHLTYHLRADDPNSVGQLIELPTALTRCAQEISEMGHTPTFEIHMIPLISDRTQREGMRPVCPPMTIRFSPENYKEEIKQGTAPISMALDAIIEMSRSSQQTSLSSTNPAVTSSDTRTAGIDQLRSDNAFLIARREAELMQGTGPSSIT